VSKQLIWLKIMVVKNLQNRKKLWTRYAANKKLSQEWSLASEEFLPPALLRLPMKFRTRLSLLALESRENPSLSVAPPYTGGAPAASGPATAGTSGGATTTTGTGQITSTGNVNVTTTNTNTTTATGGTGSTTGTGILSTGNNLSGQPLLESSLVNN
jgi:hypothetical protein